MVRVTKKDLEDRNRALEATIIERNQTIKDNEKHIKGYEETLQKEYERNDSLQYAINQIEKESYYNQWKAQQQEIEYLKGEIQRLEYDKLEILNDQGRSFAGRIRDLEATIANMAIKANQ